MNKDNAILKHLKNNIEKKEKNSKCWKYARKKIMKNRQLVNKEHESCYTR